MESRSPQAVTLLTPMNRENWLQSNLTLLANAFQREVVGIHNPTKGLLFDLIECLIQRDLDYKIQDIRQGRMQLRKALSSTTTKKVVLILHFKAVSKALPSLTGCWLTSPTKSFPSSRSSHSATPRATSTTHYSLSPKTTKMMEAKG